jgi:hypothetical protein
MFTCQFETYYRTNSGENTEKIICQNSKKRLCGGAFGAAKPMASVPIAHRFERPLEAMPHNA